MADDTITLEEPGLRLGDVVHVNAKAEGCYADRLGVVADRHGDFTHVRFPSYGNDTVHLFPNADLEKRDMNQMYRNALYVVDPGACNASGVILSMAGHLDMIRLEDSLSATPRGTDYLNEHPVITLFLSQLIQLNRSGCSDQDAFDKAYGICKAKGGK